MRLKDLLVFDNIVIQCHDNPDADTIACGYAVYLYLEEHGKEPDLIYGGRNRIRKSNLVMMVKDLAIPIRHTDCLEEPELLVMVDCQYKGGNAAVFSAKQVVVIDHHRVSTELPELSAVNPNLGACSTLVWYMLKREKFDVLHNRELSTALYYGLYTDTGGFAEVVHPLDKDLRDQAVIDKILITKYRNANMSLEDLEVTATALLRSDYIDEYRAAIVKAGPCDPNILGIISDLVLEVDAVDICVVFNVQPGAVKFSVRSCVKEVRASELAAELSKGIGGGGGHAVKAGGSIQMDLLKTEYLAFCEQHQLIPRLQTDSDGGGEKPALSGIKVLLEHRLKEYMSNTEILYSGDCRLNADNAQRFSRRSIPWGYVRATDVAPEGAEITVRSMQGDVDIVVQPDVAFVIGPMGEVYFRKEKAFLRQYRVYPDWKYYLRGAEYEPTIKIKSAGAVKSLMSSAKVCVPSGRKTIYAQRLDRKVKLFREGDPDQQYILGRVGDYLVDSSDQVNGVYIMKKELFEKAYLSVEDSEQQKAVVFDLDGTLLNTLEDLKEAVNAALLSNDMPVCTLEQVRQYVGNGVRKLMIRAVPGGENNPHFEEALAEFKAYYKEHCLDNTMPYPDIMNLLQELKARDIKTAIVSNKIDFAVKELNECFFAEYVETAIGEMDGVARKPAPDMVTKALSELGMEQKNAVYVGDSDVDIQTAGNAGLPCISVGWGFRDEKFLRENGAETVAQTPLELLYLI